MKTIDEYYGTRGLNGIGYSNGRCDFISDLYNDFIVKNLAKQNVLEDWHDLLVEYLFKSESDPILFVRKYESTRSTGKWNTRRGCVSRFIDETEYVFSSNFLAHDIYLMAYNDFCPSLRDFSDMVNTRKLRNTIGTAIERRIALYPGNNKKLKCYLAHIAAVNGAYLHNGIFAPLNRVESRFLYPLGEERDWDNPDKIRIINASPTAEQIALIKAHTLRLLDPINYFPTPQTRHCKHAVVGLNKNIGDHDPVVDYVAYQFSLKFLKRYDEFVELARFKMPSAAVSNDYIGLDYLNGRKGTIMASKKASARSGTSGRSGGMYSDALKLEVAYYFLTHRDSLIKIEIDVIKTPTPRHGSTAKSILDSLGIPNIKKGVFLDTDIESEIATATGDYRNTLIQIKGKYNL